MSNEVATKEYRSPLTKLVRFFAKSRDQWKEKCQVGKRRLKSLSTQLDWTRNNRDGWRELAVQRKAEIEQLRAELEAIKKSRP